MFKISKWYNNYQAPAVLMIDDLSDAYIDVYSESYKNDWGYLCDLKGSSFHFLDTRLLVQFPYIKITFFVPYLRHNVINENSKYKIKKYALGERPEYKKFLVRLNSLGHEIAHHGSNHGKYINEKISQTKGNWVHEWVLFDDIETGIKITLDGVKKFKEMCNIEITGGKYCGYIERENSQEIIDKCNFLYWCNKSIGGSSKKEKFFGKNEIVAFPTNFSGNSFVRLKYFTGNKQRDRKKKFFKYLQPLYDFYSYIRLYRLYIYGHIISIQEHISPSTTSGHVQSANIITDISSLQKIFAFLSKLSVWYATANEIARYIYTREKSNISIQDNLLIIYFENSKKIVDTVISVIHEEEFTLTRDDKIIFSIKNNGLYVANIMIVNGENRFKIKKGGK